MRNDQLRYLKARRLEFGKRRRNCAEQAVWDGLDQFLGGVVLENTQEVRRLEPQSPVGEHACKRRQDVDEARGIEDADVGRQRCEDLGRSPAADAGGVQDHNTSDKAACLFGIPRPEDFIGNRLGGLKDGAHEDNGGIPVSQRGHCGEPLHELDELRRRQLGCGHAECGANVDGVAGSRDHRRQDVEHAAQKREPCSTNRNTAKGEELLLCRCIESTRGGRAVGSIVSGLDVLADDERSQAKLVPSFVDAVERHEAASEGLDH